MAVSFQDYISVLKTDKIRRPKVRVEFLRYEDESVSDTVTGYVENGSGLISISNKNGQRRSLSVTLTNVTGRFTPNPDGLWLRQKIRVWAGLEINGEDYLFKQGVFVIEDPSALSQGSNHTLSITASDKFSLMDGSIGGETEGIYIVPVGSSIPQTIRGVLQPSTESQSEVFYDPIEPIIDTMFDSETTPYTITVAEGEPISNILIELAGMLSSNVYYNVDGQLVFEFDSDDNMKGSQFDFISGDINYMGTTQKFLNSKVYNACLVVGANINGDIARYYLENLNPLSDTSIINVGWKRVLKIDDQNIYNDTLAEYRAIYELKRAINLQSEHSLTCVPMYHLDVDTIITITDEKSLGLNRKRYLINSISLPLSTNGTMSINCAESIDIVLQSVGGGGGGGGIPV